MDASLSPAPLLPEVLPAPVAGAIVRLPDGTIATVAAVNRTEAHVVRADLRLGRGPWPFRTSYLTPATRDEASDYARRCVDLIARQQVRL